MKSISRLTFIASLLFHLVITTNAFASDNCFDLTKGQPRSLSGFLSATIFPGPPNFEDVQSGDAPEPGFILRLSSEICIDGDDFADPSYQFNEVQLFAYEPMILRKMQNFSGELVSVTISDAFASHTGHHHRPLVARISEIQRRNVDQTDEYGTAATTVRGFYYALAQGNGETASNFVVPEKRTKRAYSPLAITNFYSNLLEPLRLEQLTIIGPDEFLVEYYFKSTAGVCNGSAKVKTVQRSGYFYIRNIDAINGC